MSVIAIANSDAFDIFERAPGGVVIACQSVLLTLRAKRDAEAGAGTGAGTGMGAGATTEAHRPIVLTQPGGLHARPAASAREAARGFDARVEVHFGGRKAPIESVVGLLGLCAGEHATIELVGRGVQAQQAVDAVARELLREAHGEAEETPARTMSPAPKPAVQIGRASCRERV